MATAISIANFQNALGEVYDALTASNFQSAHLWLARAEAQLAGLPLVASIEGSTLTRFREGLSGLTKAVQAAEKRATSSLFEKHSRWIV
jgi:hypothetical protein